MSRTQRVPVTCRGPGEPLNCIRLSLEAHGEGGEGELGWVSQADSACLLPMASGRGPPRDALIQIKVLASACDLCHVKGKDSLSAPALHRLLMRQGLAHSTEAVAVPGKGGVPCSWLCHFISCWECCVHQKPHCSTPGCRRYNSSCRDPWTRVFLVGSKY